MDVVIELHGVGAVAVIFPAFHHDALEIGTVGGEGTQRFEHGGGVGLRVEEGDQAQVLLRTGIDDCVSGDCGDSHRHDHQHSQNKKYELFHFVILLIKID